MSAMSAMSAWLRRCLAVASVGVFLAALCGFAGSAGAFQVKRVVRGQVAMSTSQEISTADLTSLIGGVPIELTKSFILATSRTNNDNNAMADIYVTLDDPQTVLARRRQSGTAQTVEFMIVEFVDGVNVQSGITTFSEVQTSATKNIVLPSSVDTAKSFPLISWWSFSATNSSAVDERNNFSAELTSSTNLQIRRSENNAAYNNDIYYQVVSFDADVSVRSGTVLINAAVGAGETSDNGTTLVAPLSPALSSTGKAMLFFTTRPNNTVNGVEGRYAVDGYINATNEVTFNRATNSNNVTVIYYVAEFSNEMFVQHARDTTSLPVTTGTTATINLPTATVLARSAGPISVSGGAGTTNTYLSDIKVAAQLSYSAPNTRITVTRDSAAIATPFSYNIAEYPPVNVEVLNSPGTVWKVGESRQITWKHADDVAANTAAIELSVDGGSAWLGTAITCTEGARTMADDVCTWVIPNDLGGTSVIGSNLKVRVRDTVLSSRNFDASNAAFEIKGTVTVASPSNAGIVWNVGDACPGANCHTISWTNTGAHGTTKARVKLQTVAGVDITTISDCVVNIEDNTLDWAAVGDYIGTDRKIRVESCADATNVFDVSDNAFEIRGSVTVTYPNGAETLETQKAYNITWNKTGTFAPNNEVNITYSKNSGGQYPTTIATNQPAGAGSGSYSWTPASGDVSDFARVKVTQRDNTNVTDESNADFSVKPSIVVTAPNGGQTWLVGESQNITWTTNGAGLANVKIEYSTNGGGAYSPIIENDGTANDGIVTNNGTRAWDIPDAIAVDNVLIRISNPSTPSINDVSDAVFSIKGQTQVSAPNGGQSWTIGGGFGTTSRIQWNNLGSFIDGASKVEIRYSTNGGGLYPVGNTIVSNETNSGASDFYDWTIAENIVVGTENTTMRIQVTPTDAEAVGDTSDANFTIRAGLRVDSPNGGETWTLTPAVTKDISWTKSGDISNVNLKYSLTNGSDNYPVTIVNNRLSTASPYTWTLPANIVSTQAKVKAEAVGAEATIFDESNSTFTVKGTLTVLSPNGGETWYVSDTSRNITWDAVGTGGPMDGKVDILYSTNGGSSYPGVVVSGAGSVLASAELFNWNPIPAAAQSDTFRVKVLLQDDPLVEDASDANFFIKPKLTVSAPNGGQTWIVGASQNITWTTAGTVGNVDLLYSTDSGGNYPGSPNIATDLTNVGSYAWTVPDSIGTQLRVKVASNPADAAVVDQSDADFVIRGSLTLTAPNGSEIWIVGAANNVTWTKTGSLTGNVKLYYSTDGGANYAGDPASPFATVAVGAGSYSWTIPDIIGSTVRVKVVYANDTNVFDASDANFTVKGSLTITAPNGGEVWDLGSGQNITWNKTGTIGNVDLSLSLDGGTDGYATSIATGVSSASPYAWAIPAGTPLTTQGRVRIAPVTAAQAAADTSDANFRLRGSFTLTAPNGSETWIVGTAYNITWTKVGGMANAKLEYSRDGGVDGYPHVIVASTAAGTGSYSWTVAHAASDTDKTNSSQMRVKVSDASDATVQDASNANFTVKGSLTITAPNGGENWLMGSAQNITWARTGKIPNVKLVYSTDGGGTFPEAAPDNTIVASTSGEALTYAWTVPDRIGSQLRIKIYDLSNPAADADESNGNFTIRGAFTLTSPNGGEQLGIAGSHDITWTRTGTVTENVKLVYSANGGSSYPEPSQVIASGVAASAQTYAWTVPDAPTTQARVKIIHTPVSTPLADADESNANFSIKGTLTIVAPNGAENWKVGESRNITWTRGGSIANVRLSYSTNSGGTFPNQIIASTPGADLAYAWTVPDVSATTVRVKIEDVGDATVADTSNADFTIKPTLTLTAPNGGQSWVVNDSQNITWTKAGTIANVKLVYSTDGGGTFPEAAPDNTIIASTPGADLSYAWTIPDAIGSQLRVKIVKTDDAAVVDTSDANFTIKGSLALTSPNGGETWIVGEARNVTWTKTGSIANVKLEYSKNGFTNESQTFTLIASTAAAPLSYAWTVSDAIGTQIRVRVSDVLDSAVNDISNADFSIKGALSLTAPNGGQTWAVGTVQNITWTRSGSITNVKIDYSGDSGGTFPNAIIASTDASTGTYAWTIPAGAVLTTQGRIRVQDASDSAVYDDSNADFNVVGSLVLTAPNGGEIWAYNTSQNITWTRSGNNLANVKLEYSTNSGSTYPNVIIGSTAAATQSYTWTVPNEHSATVRVKVSDAAAAFTGLVNDASNANFKIRSSLTLTAPDGGEVWTVASAQSITWTSSGTVNNVALAYSTNGGTSYDFLVTASAPNTGSYSWTVPDAIGTSVRVKVTDAEDADAFDASNGNFKIRGALLVTAPNGGEQWGIATSKNVTWTRTGSIANVKLDYSLDGGTNYDGSIVASTAASAGTYAWTIPDFPSTTARVKVADAADALLVFDTSNANFSIKGSVAVTAPNGGETWIVGADNNITWNKFGSISNVEIRYSENGGSTWPAGNIIVASTAAAAGTYTWTIPDKIGNNVLVRITDVNDTSTLDDSDAAFSIKGSLTVTAPNGSETWIVGEARNITWTKTGTLGNAKIEMSTNGGSTYPTEVVNPVAAVDGAYAWTVPDAIGSQVRVKITLLSDTAVNDASNADFTVKGSLTLNAPNGGEVWSVGGSQPITWSRVGSIANVELKYSTNGGVSYDNTIVASTAASAGSYGWTIPDAITTTARVKVTDVLDASVTDTSNANFKIAGSLVLTAPNGGEAWLIGGSQNITWTRTGSIANVKLEYSTNSGSTYPNEIIASTDASTGTYAWTIPDAPTTAARVKVTNTSDSTVFDASNADFNMRGSLTVTAPNGGEVWDVGSGQNITWTKSGSISNVELRYSTNSGGAYPNVIVASTAAGALAYAWTVPDAISTAVRVKITDTTDSAVTDTSNADFKIKGSVTLTAPNGAEVWIVGGTQNITWTRVGSFANVKLDYSVDGGVDGYANAITASAPAAPLAYAWTIPDAIGTQLRVRVADAADSAVVFDASDANFTIKGSLTLNAPNGGETWIVGASQNIAWAKTGTLGDAKLEYSTNSGSTYPNTIVNPVPAADLTYAWTVPDSISGAVRVKVTLLSDTTVADASNADFAIKGSLALTSPNGGETWIVGETRSITWTKTGSIATARLDYSTNGGVSYPNVITASTGAGGLSFLWTVPDNMSTSVKVRIQNTADATVEDASNADFKIAGSFTLTSPNGAEKWPAGSGQVITWSKTGSIANAKLEYSTDGGSTFPNLIVATTPASNLSYAWTLGSATTTQARVRITDVSDSTVNDVSNANFKIMGGFTLAAPNGGEVWVVAGSQNITWGTAGTVANVRLDYSTDGGASYPNPITASTTNTGSYGWTIPDAIGTTLRVKVEDVLDTDAKDESDNNFKIKGSVTVTAPNGGEIWDVGSSQNITWTKTGTIANVKIEYSIDGGTNYPGGGQIIVASQNAAAGTYAWTVPDQIYTTMRIRITDVTDATVVDQSNANFTIRGAFTLTAPNGAEKWKVGTSQSITWSTFGTIPNVRLEYSTDGGSSYPNVITASSANSGTFNWTIPNAISTTARVRVLNAADTGTLDASNANFKIMANFTVTAPDGGEVLTVGSSYDITWTTQGSVSNVELKYSTNSGSTYPNTINASTSNNGTFSWTVPDAISATLRVRVADATDATDAFDTSNADFKIRAGFTVTAPNGSEAWPVSGVRNITWTTAGTVASVKLEYSTNSGGAYTNITGSTANSGTYAWTVPDAITTAGRVRVSDVNDSTANDASNADFKIQGSLVITAPNGAEKWTVATIQTVTWDRTGSIPNVKLDFSTNGGTIYAPITASASNTGSYAWTIPDNVSTNCLVKITDTNDSTVTDVSDAAFKIQAGFVVTAPNGGEVWGIGSSRNITWTTNGTVSFVKIDYSTDSGATYPLAVTGSTSNTGAFNWTVPDAISGTVRVKVSQTTDAEAFDTSDGNFRIRATLGLVAPNGAEIWRVGQSRNLTWTVSGTIPNVRLQYSRDGFNVDIQNINAAAPQTGSYAWTVPDAISNTVRVRVSDPNDIGAFDDSNADFKIIANFMVTSPNGSEQWTVGSSQNITWTSAGSVANVKLEYSTNSGGNWTAILGSTANDGTQGWTVPDAISANARVRVSDPADATSFDDSDNDFKIKSLFGLTAPNGGEIWTVGQAQNITWTNTGTVANVRLTYSTNSGGAYGNTISASTANANTYAWTVPDSISTLVRVKVESTTDVDAFDASDADFKIRGAFSLTSPNGGEAWGIAQNRAVTWTTTGTIPNVKLSYSTNGGGAFGNVIAASVANTNTYTWSVADAPTTQARMRVEDVADATVLDDSNANFSIQGNFTLTSPNGGESWAVNGNRNITWNWGGTIPNVKLSYSTNSGAAYPNVIAASAPNGAGSSGAFSYAWTVPDAISTTIRVRVEDANDAAVFDASDADFKIQAGFNMVAPNGGERWVVNESRTIQWTTGGTVPNVKLEYSTDGGSIYANTIVASTANTGSYAWTVPNTMTALARVRVVDAADAAVSDASDADFTIDLYQITFNIKDLLSNNQLDQITVNGANNNNGAYTWAASGLTSPILKGLQYGTWPITFTRVEYGDQTVNVVVDRDQTVNVYMETQVVHIWEAKTEIAYNTDSDLVTVSSTLQRDGSTVTGATSCAVKFYDGSTLIKTLSNAGAPDANGFYSFTWPTPTGLVAGKVYNVVTTMSITTGGVFNTPRTFNITDVKKLKDLETTVNNRLNTDLVTMQNNIRGDLTTQTGVITGALSAQTTAINTSLANFETKSNEQIGALKLRADEIKSAGGELQKSSEELNATNAKFAGNLILPGSTLLGDTNVKLQYRALPGLVPLITVTTLDVNGKTNVVVNAVPMTASSTQPDLYEYVIDKVTSPPYTPGKKAGVVVEATTFQYVLQAKSPIKNIEAGSFLVESTTLSTLEGLIAGQGTSQIKDMVSTVLDAMRGVEASFAGGGSIVAALDNLNRKVDRLPSEFAKSAGKQDILEMKNTLNEVATQVKSFAGESVGADLAEILGKALDESSSMRDLRKKSDVVQGSIEITQQLMEQKLGGIDDPVIHAIYQ